MLLCERQAGTVPIVREDAEPPPDPKDFVQSGKKIEVLAPSKRWRPAEVVRRLDRGAVVHYVGFDEQFDEIIDLDSGRFRPRGQLAMEDVGNMRNDYTVEAKKGHCPGCGAKFQTSNPQGLGYIPPEKLPQDEDEMAAKILSPEEEVDILLKGESFENVPAVSFRSRTTQKKYKVIQNVYLDLRTEPDIDAPRVEGKCLRFGDTFDVSEIFQGSDLRSYFKLADGRGWAFDWAEVHGSRLQLVEPVDDGWEAIKAEKKRFKAVCMRCWSLWNYNDCDDVLRPEYGKGAESELVPEKFKVMLRETLSDAKDATILAVVDIFDFSSSFKMLEFLANELRAKKGQNIDVKIIANKRDLLPVEVKEQRICAWVAREASKAGLRNFSMTHVFLVSALKGNGIKGIARLLTVSAAKKTFYFVGAANAGKSSVLNRLSFRNSKGTGSTPANQSDGYTVSCMPGTTLRPMTMKFQRGGIKLVDTPGLFVPGSIAELLPMSDLRRVVPQEQNSYRLTFNMQMERSVLIGGLAQIASVEGWDSRWTFFFNQKVKLHNVSTESAVERARKMAGGLLTPPTSKKTFEQLQPWVPHRFEFQGAGWHLAAVDIVFAGLGWVSCTCCGWHVVEAYAPKGVEVTMRPPLLPFEARWTGVTPAGAPGWYRRKRKSIVTLSMKKPLRRKEDMREA